MNGYNMYNFYFCTLLHDILSNDTRLLRLKGRNTVFYRTIDNSVCYIPIMYFTGANCAKHSALLAYSSHLLDNIIIGNIYHRQSRRRNGITDTGMHVAHVRRCTSISRFLPSFRCDYLYKLQ